MATNDGWSEKDYLDWDDIRLPVLLGDSGGESTWQTEASERFCKLPCFAEVVIMNGQGKGAAWHNSHAPEACASIFWITPDTPRAIIALLGSVMTYSYDSVVPLVGIDPNCPDAKELRQILLAAGQEVADTNACDCSKKIYKSLSALLDAAEKQILHEADGIGPVGEEYEELCRECDESDEPTRSDPADP